MWSASPSTGLPYLGALRQLLAYAGGIVPALAAAYEPRPEVSEVFIFGSWARRFHGEQGPPPNAGADCRQFATIGVGAKSGEDVVAGAPLDGEDDAMKAVCVEDLASYPAGRAEYRSSPQRFGVER